jgi:phospholipid transport system transporter-binding protein
MASNASLQRDGATLRASGTLDRAAATALWPQLDSLLAGVSTLQLDAIERLDSAGLALLAEAAARVRDGGGNLDVIGCAAVLDELRAAYRLSTNLDFQASSPETT